MAISFVAAGTNATGANPTPGIPTGYAVGDLFIAFASCDTGTSAFGAVPSGWTQLFNQTTITNVPAQILYRFATSLSETAPAFSQASITASARVVAYSGVDSINVSGQTAETVNSTSHTTASITTTVANTTIVSIYHGENGGTTWTTPASTTLRVSYAGIASPAISSYLLVDETQAATGATATRSTTTSSSMQNTKTVIALKELVTTVNSDFFFMIGF